MQTFVEKKSSNLKISVDRGKNLSKGKASDKAVGPGKKSKINKCRAFVHSGL